METTLVAILAIAEIENIPSQRSRQLCGNGVSAIAAISAIGSQVYDYLSKCKIVLCHKTKLWNKSVKKPPSSSLIWNISLTQKRCFLDTAALILIPASRTTNWLCDNKSKISHIELGLCFLKLSVQTCWSRVETPHPDIHIACSRCHWLFWSSCDSSDFVATRARLLISAITEFTF